MLNTISRTVADVVQTVKRQFGDESGVQISTHDIVRWINSGQLEIVSKNGVIEGRFSANTTAAVGEYQLPTEQILHIVSIHYKGIRVESMEFQEAERKIFASDPQRTQTGIPQFWYEWAGKVTFWPAPNESVVNGITIYAIKMPTLVSVESDFLSLPDKYFEAIVNWCMAKAHELDEEFEAAATMRQQFSLSLDEKNGEEERSQHATYPVITIVE